MNHTDVICSRRDEERARCAAVARWWLHAAEGRVTLDTAIEATAALIAAIDRVDPPR